MLTKVAEGVSAQQSELLQNNGVVVHGAAGVLLVDPGQTNDEFLDLANGIRELGQPVVAGFATHPDWDHVLWHPDLGDAPRYGTARCAADLREFLTSADWKDQAAEALPPQLAGEVPLDLFGRITGLPVDATSIPWDGPAIRIIEHQAHAFGHAALLIEQPGVLVAGDMLSDVLVPMLNFAAADPIGDYLAALRLFEDAAKDVRFVIPGHGSVGDAAELEARIALDRTYVVALRDGTELDDPRLGASAKPGWEWVGSIHDGQVQQLATS